MKFIILTILFPCVFGQAEVNCPTFPEDDGCNSPHLRCEIPPGEDGCPVAPGCVHVDPYARCSLTPVCPTQCLEGDMYCPGGVDPNGCPLADVCHPMDTNSNCYSYCPVFCGPDQMWCPGGPDPNDPNGCNIPDSCIDVDNTAVCQNVCPPPPCPTPEFECWMPADYNGCNMPPTCSAGAMCPEFPM